MSGDTLRHDVLVDGRYRLVTDEPQRLGGSDRGPAPHELLPAALAACIATTIRTYTRTKGWTLGELRVDVVYDNRATRCFLFPPESDLCRIARWCGRQRSAPLNAARGPLGTS